MPSLEQIENSTAQQLDAVRQQIPEGPLRDQYDVRVGVAKGVYNFGKGIVEGALSLVGALGKVITDEKYRNEAAETAKSLAVDSMKLQFGTPEQKLDVIQKAGNFAEKAAEKAKSEMQKSWDEAKAAGKQQELLANWTTQGLLNVASFFVGAGEVKAVAEAGKVAEGAEAAADAAKVAKEAGSAASVLSKEAKIGEVSECQSAAAAAAAADTAAVVPEVVVPSTGDVLKATKDVTTTLLGNYKQDMQGVIEQLGNKKSLDFGAKPGEFNVLNVPDDLNKAPDQFWNEYNKPFLDQAIARGDDIRLVSEPVPELLKKPTGELTGFGREFQYLEKQGYSYDATLKTMVKH